MMFHENTGKTGNNVLEMSQAFHKANRTVRTFHRSKPVKINYVFNVIQNWEMVALQYFTRWCLRFVSSMVERHESSRLFWLATGQY